MAGFIIRCGYFSCPLTSWLCKVIRPARLLESVGASLTPDEIYEDARRMLSRLAQPE